MGTLSVRSGHKAQQTAKPKGAAIKVVTKSSSSEIKEKQLAELKQGLTEAILISRGEMEGIPLSELWDE